MHFFLQDCTGIIDFREYLLGVLVISKASNIGEMVELAFKVKYYSKICGGSMWWYNIVELFPAKYNHKNFWLLIVIE
jgi:hypothetical protein